ncbi:alpha/beta fold hydrolase [Thermotoga sp.]|uniref:alpha/beta hydrolase n=1 Tax=Thermotoga sp. TaxID=28240 RepID=UPI0025CC88AF|nr:alpha/beta fold hydrolase [Thermotoga sp.]MCD6550641.1 alpha/beta fold hydrolase [Thermotoga sp.]
MKLVTFQTSYRPIVEESKTVRVYVFEPKVVSHNLIFIHGIGNGNIPYLLWFGEKFREYNIKTWFLILPYHEKRAPESWSGGEPFYHPSPAYCVKRFDEAVQDVIDLVDFIEKESDKPISLMGFSFGGMITTIALAREKRIGKGIICCSGGDWRWINWYSPYTKKLRDLYRERGNEFRCRSEKDCIRNRGNTLEVIKTFESIEDIRRKSPVSCYFYDPASYAPFVEQKVLFFWALFDRVIPYRSYATLHRLLRNKKTVFLPVGHKGSYFFRRYIARKVARFLKDDE